VAVVVVVVVFVRMSVFGAVVVPMRVVAFDVNVLVVVVGVSVFVRVLDPVGMRVFVNVLVHDSSHLLRRWPNAAEAAFIFSDDTVRIDDDRRALAARERLEPVAAFVSFERKTGIPVFDQPHA
jgi:hypothetical protein